MSAVERRLAGRYRVLLWWYPREYRREHGEELVSTMLRRSAPGRRWPTVREVTNLIHHGLRCRLGRPDSRSVVVWAALTAVVCGLFTAALATRVAWETSRPLPDHAEAAAVFRTALPDYDFDGIGRDPALFIVYGEPLGAQHVDDLLLGDGGEYQQGATTVWMEGTPIDLRRAISTAQQRLRAAGWTVVEPTPSNAVECADKRCDPASLSEDTTLTARRDDTYVEITIYGDPANTTPDLAVTLYRTTPPVVYPAGIAGGLLGGLAGWLLFGWASRRTAGRRIAGRVKPTSVYAVVMVMWCGPMLYTIPAALEHHLTEPHLLWHPLWSWLGQPAFSLPFLVGGAAALFGLAFAALPRRDTAVAAPLTTQ